jgi:putative thiamine transport system substrate-binding protein
MKDKGLLHGPFTQVMPNYRLVDVTTKRSNVVDFTVPVDGLESPWRLAQVVYVYDSARHAPDSMPRSINALLDWSRAHPGRLTHPTVRNFLGATFLKQALYELAPAPEVLQSPATDASFAATTAPLWAWYDRLRPTLWRAGREFPRAVRPSASC